MKIEALLFDVDGTLADTEESHRQAFNAAFRALDLPFSWDRAQYARLVRVPGGKARLVHFFESQALGAAETARLVGLVPELHRTKTRHFEALVASGAVPLLPGVARLVHEAWDAGLRVGIASTTSEANVKALLAAGLGPDAEARFAVIACGDMVAAKKPAPDIYRLALGRLGLSAEGVIAFEDSAAGLRAAQGAALFTVVTPTAWSGDDDLSAADLLLPHLGDPDRPLEGEAAARAGGPFVTLERLAALARLTGSSASGSA